MCVSFALPTISIKWFRVCSLNESVQKNWWWHKLTVNWFISYWAINLHWLHWSVFYRNLLAIGILKRTFSLNWFNILNETFLYARVFQFSLFIYTSDGWLTKWEYQFPTKSIWYPKIWFLYQKGYHFLDDCLAFRGCAVFEIGRKIFCFHLLNY